MFKRIPITLLCRAGSLLYLLPWLFDLHQFSEVNLRVCMFAYTLAHIPVVFVCFNSFTISQVKKTDHPCSKDNAKA